MKIAKVKPISYSVISKTLSNVTARIGLGVFGGGAPALFISEVLSNMLAALLMIGLSTTFRFIKFASRIKMKRLINVAVLR